MKLFLEIDLSRVGVPTDTTMETIKLATGGQDKVAGRECRSYGLDFAPIRGTDPNRRLETSNNRRLNAADARR